MSIQVFKHDEGVYPYDTYQFPINYGFANFEITFPEDDTIYLSYIAIKRGDVFHAFPCSFNDDKTHLSAAVEGWGFAYGPVNQAMTLDDVEGATYAWKDSNGLWNFAHCSPDEQVDFAASAELYTVELFSIHIAKAMLARTVATDTATQTVTKRQSDNLISFAQACGRRAHKLVLDQTLGYYHRLPHHDHRREIALACIEAEKLAWIASTKKDTDFLDVQSTYNTLKARLESTHVIEWRHEREKRLNDASAARGNDPVAGYEYCYVLSQTAAVITGPLNLPDPAWPFDRLRTGTIGRGLFVYSDAEPKTNSLLSWVVRFKRPIPEGTQPGADIGSVAWTQEDAYQP